MPRDDAIGSEPDDRSLVRRDQTRPTRSSPDAPSSARRASCLRATSASAPSDIARVWAGSANISSAYITVPTLRTIARSLVSTARTSSSSRSPAYDQAMGDKSQRGSWTDDEIKREQAAERARVLRDAARGVSQNLENAVAHTEFAKRFAEAFKPLRKR